MVGANKGNYMGLIDKLFGKKESEVEHPASTVKAADEVTTVKSETPKPKKPKEAKPKKTAKQLATEKGEPWVNIISVELDPENIGQGAFELDWNEFFVAKLVRAGYKGRDDQQIVDQWFQDVCRNVVLETYEQMEANNPRPPTGVQRRDLGGGRTEVS
jgi:hypothetical protein